MGKRRKSFVRIELKPTWSVALHRESKQCAWAPMMVQEGVLQLGTREPQSVSKKESQGLGVVWTRPHLRSSRSTEAKGSAQASAMLTGVCSLHLWLNEITEENAQRTAPKH